MEMIIDFLGSSRVDIHFGTFTDATDEPPVASAPSPFELFRASIIFWAEIYVLGFCKQRNLPAERIHSIERINYNPNTRTASSAASAAFPLSTLPPAARMFLTT
jgi:ribosomal protein S12 methylthiotransferase accessory factor